MFKKVLSIILLLLLVSVAIVQAMEKKKVEKPIESQTALAASGIKTGKAAPDFTLKTLEGKAVQLSDLKGKKVILNFWATWCPPCKKEIPEIEAYAKNAPKDEMILAVNMDPYADVKGFSKKMGITFPILLDTDNEVNTSYKIVSIPTTYFIDKKGIVRNKIMGAMTKEDLKQNMNSHP
ncbi:peroxiredoxin family protein [Peribacillus kribbensis]|uniref:peroxiredoxin family protein n=1 Tax=Peribacillus kribbensis TaxID=356658 RepID=UPI0004165990|nr:TlpA disulfide reductase family protein [Peribacillus kribbensis]